MTISKKLKTYTIQLQTLTPLHIGSGEVLSPYTDFVCIPQSKNCISFIDQQVFEENLSKNADLMNKFIDGTRKGSAGNFDLLNFILYDLKLNPIPIKSRIHRFNPKEDIGKKQLSKFIHSIGKPFIPGSSVKGAIRTALLYKNLKANASNFVEQIRKTQGDNKEIDKVLENYEKELNLTDLCRGIKVRDSSFLKMDNLRIMALKKEGSSKEQNSFNLPLIEVLQDKVEINLEICLEELMSLSSISIEEIFQALNEFSQDCLEYEKQNNSWTKNTLQKIEIPSVDSKKAIIRLGQGKTYFDNSIGLILQKKDSELFKKFRKLYFPQTKEDQIFPKTRTLTSQNEPLGWVQLTNITEV